MFINNRIKQLEREANAKVNKFHKVEIYIGEWCCDDSNCPKCKNADSLPSKKIINGELVINVGVNNQINSNWVGLLYFNVVKIACVYR